MFILSREQAWFHRLYNDETKIFDGKILIFKGQKENWKKNTRSDQLFFIYCGTFK